MYSKQLKIRQFVYIFAAGLQDGKAEAYLQKVLDIVKDLKCHQVMLSTFRHAV